MAPQGRIRLVGRRIVLLVLVGCFMVWGDYQQMVRQFVVYDGTTTKKNSIQERAIVVPDTVVPGVAVDAVDVKNITQQHAASNADAMIQKKDDNSHAFSIHDEQDKDDSARRPPQPPRSASSSPSNNSSSLQQQQQHNQHHILATWLIHRNKIFLFEMGDEEQGFGSVTNHLLLLILYFADAHNNGRHHYVVVDESPSSAYRRNQTHGMFSGYFDTTFSILQDSKNDYALIRQQVTQMDQVVQDGKENDTTSPTITTNATDPLFWKFTDPDFYSHKNSMSKPWTEGQYRNITHDLPVVKVTTRSPRTTYWPYRRMLMKYYKEHYNKDINDKTMAQQEYLRMFQRFSQLLCQSIQVNEEVQGRIIKMHQNAGIATKRNTTIGSGMDAVLQADSTTDSTTSTDAATRSTSVAFHVRRGDKLERESRKYEAWEYVMKLMNVTTDQERSHIRHCFVATDDYSVVAELQFQLTHTASIACHVSTLTLPTPPPNSTLALPSGNRQGGEEFILFLAQLDVLIHSTYFIGTFNSHVGKLVTLYRGCPYHTKNDSVSNNNDNKSDDWKDPHPRFTVDQVSTKLNHYYLSYGVDTEDWFFSQVDWQLWRAPNL